MTEPTDPPGGPDQAHDRPAHRRQRIGRLLILCALLSLAGCLVLVSHLITRASEARWDQHERLHAGRPLAGDLESEPGMLPVVLRSMIADRRPENALAIVRGQPPQVRLAVRNYEVAALLELGELERARTLWQHPDARRSSPFSARIQRTLAATHNGLQAALFDRSGVPIAYRHSDGRTELEQRIDGRDVPNQVLAALPAVGGARTTLDLALSRRLRSAFEGRLRSRVRGGIVVLDARDGAVLAAATTESPQDGAGHDFLLNRREPASIAKLLTTTATLRAGLDPDGEIRSMRCNGSIDLGRAPLYCSSIGGNLRGLDHALASSCNVAFAALGRRIGPQALLDEYRAFGFVGDTVRSPLYGSLLTPEPTARELGDLSIGLNAVEITPLHAAVFARTFVDGYLRAPYHVVAEDGLLGLSPTSSRAPGDQDGWLGRPSAPVDVLDGSSPILSAQWLPELQRAMVAVGDPGGTANGLEPRGFTVAMKTGTASDPATGFHVNYVGFAPADAPRYAFAIRLTHGRTSRSIRRQAAAVTRGVLDVLARDERRRDASVDRLTLGTVEPPSAPQTQLALPHLQAPRPDPGGRVESGEVAAGAS